jgi:hypothetical protein
MNDYYIYALIDPRDNSPYYIGKGMGDRYKKHFCNSTLENRNPHRSNKIKKLRRLGYTPKDHVTKVATGLSEERAYELEEFIISEIGLENLTNLVGGGIGGTTNRGSENYRASITEEQASYIKYIRGNSTLTIQEIADWVDCSFYVAHDITKGKSWKHVKPRKPDGFTPNKRWTAYKEWRSTSKSQRCIIDAYKLDTYSNALSYWKANDTFGFETRYQQLNLDN